PGLATDYWFVHARPDDPGGLTNPANWTDELRLTNRSFDLERAPGADRGLFVGDYEGLATAGNSFLAFWAQPGRTDPANVFFRRLPEGRHGPYLVTTRHDRGLGSLPEAVLEANAYPGHNDIRFARDLHGTIALTSGELDVTNDLTIQGRGADQL